LRCVEQFYLLEYYFNKSLLADSYLYGVRSDTLVDALKEVRVWCQLRGISSLNSPVIVCMSLGAPRGKPEDIKQWGGDTFFVMPWS
jgi:hypothetical protein